MPSRKRRRLPRGRALRLLGDRRRAHSRLRTCRRPDARSRRALLERWSPLRAWLAMCGGRLPRVLLRRERLPGQRRDLPLVRRAHGDVGRVRGQAGVRQGRGSVQAADRLLLERLPRGSLPLTFVTDSGRSRPMGDSAAASRAQRRARALRRGTRRVRGDARVAPAHAPRMERSSRSMRTRCTAAGTFRVRGTC
jgi:hypothetical protein